MMLGIKYLLIVFLLIIMSFKTSSQTLSKIDSITISDVKMLPSKPLPLNTFQIKIAAYLVYDDSTVSSFDILNDRTITLWNVIAGGDSSKSSHKTKVILSGRQDSTRITIFNGKNKIIDKLRSKFTGDTELIINNTGCEEVKILVSKNREIQYQKSIHFHCGE